MNVLLTGNRGYIGAVLGGVLRENGHTVKGYDTGYYRECALFPFGEDIEQIQKDIRDASSEDFKGIDAVIHLAALSNDPLGELIPGITEEINYHGTMTLARAAKAAGVKRFVYGSSQSMYGISKVDHELDEDNSEKNPLTAYAKAKWDAELELKEMNSKEFVVVCFRPSTVFGASPMFRSDIVFNNLVGCAYTTGRVEIKSDGTPWRPTVHVRDVSRAFLAGLEVSEELVSGQSFNVGVPNGNYTIREIAEAAQRAVPGSELVFTGEHGSDSRTYQVSFSRILSVLKDYYKPEWDLDKGAKELVEFFEGTGFTKEHFRGKATNRLQQINRLLEESQLGRDLRWVV